MSEWQPIETAPKDETDVLVCRMDADGSYWTAVAQWWVGSWAFMAGSRLYPSLLCFEPTHWMPLPKPPA